MKEKEIINVKVKSPSGYSELDLSVFEKLVVDAGKNFEKTHPSVHTDDVVSIKTFSSVITTSDVSYTLTPRNSIASSKQIDTGWV